MTFKDEYIKNVREYLDDVSISELEVPEDRFRSAIVLNQRKFEKSNPELYTAAREVIRGTVVEAGHDFPMFEFETAVMHCKYKKAKIESGIGFKAYDNCVGMSLRT